VERAEDAVVRVGGAALVEIVSTLASRGAQAIWLVEVPTHPASSARVPDHPEQVAATRRLLEQVAADTVAASLLLPEDVVFREDDFGDTNHLDRAGAARYTEWLARALAPEIGPCRR
jgi:hypothetical protein